jgi:murein DD-endopeptidase MepM/ murein hydrolase activator NlpD
MKKRFNRKFMLRAARLLAAVVLVAAMTTPYLTVPAQAVSRTQIQKLKKNAGGLSAKKKELQKKLDALSNSKADTLERKKLLDAKIGIIAAQIANSQAQISKYSGMIAKEQAQLETAQKKEQAQYALYRKRVRAMEERGTISYWSVLFKASSFTDLLSRLDFINEIMDSDQNVITQLQETQKQIKSRKASLESNRSASQAAKSDLVARKSDLNAQQQAASQLVAQIDQNANDYQDTLDAISKEEDEIEDRIVKMSQELAAKEEAERKAREEEAKKHGNTTPVAPVHPDVSSEGYIWPVSSHRISSPFGYRSASSTNGVGSTYHKGIDIAGVGYGTAVHAAKSGTVLLAQYSNSYGNYVVISHGSGNTTLYAHMSSLAVSAGQYVKQGTVVGYTGSTGHSTGPHLHFEITIGGSRVNPANYLP